MRLNGITSRIIVVILIPVIGMVAFSALWMRDRAIQLGEARDADARLGAALVLGETAYAARMDAATTGLLRERRMTPALGRLVEVEHAEAEAALADKRADLERVRPQIQAWLGDAQWHEIATALERHDRLNTAMHGVLDGPAPLRAIAERRLWLNADELGRQLVHAETRLLGDDSVADARTLWQASELSSAILAQLQIIAPAQISGRLEELDAARAAALDERSDALTDELAADLPPDLAVAVGSLLESDYRERVDRVLDETVTSVLDGDGVPTLGLVEFAQAGGAFRDYISDLADARELIGQRLVGEAQAATAAARRDLVVAASVTAVLLLLTLALVVLLARSTTRGLGRLTERARDITRGRINGAPLPETGPDDLATLTRAVNEMSRTLSGVETRVLALADGAAPEAVDSVPMPGEMGAALDRAVGRVTAMTEQLRAREALARSIVDTAAEAVWTVDADGVIRTANSAASRLTGFTREGMIEHPADAVPPVALVMARARTGRGGVHRPLDAVQMELPGADGFPVPTIVSTRSIEDEDGRPLWTIFAFDLTERIEQERKLEHEASHDALTGLPNRGSALQAIGAALIGMEQSGEGGCALLFVDLDRFKHVNDAQGHRVGDELLTGVAERLRESVRPDDVVARLGGDEFLVVLAGSASPDEAMTVAHRAQQALAEPFRLRSGGRAWVSASIGVSWTRRGAVGAEGLLREADMAMYRAKEHGRGAVALFDESMRAWAAERSEIEQELRAALAGDRLEAVFQPVVDLASGDVVGAELLARLPTESGHISPGRFIEVAEDSGMVVDIGRWALRTACARLAEWEAKGHDSLRIMVNISGVHLAGGDLVQDVVDAAAVLDGGLHRLGIEITESFLLQDERGARATLEEVRATGCVVALDDFGTGYSSLEYLRGLPVDIVKIDRSFITEMETDAIDSAIVTSVAGLSRARGLRVVAEGIETEGQAASALGAGCDLGQGFLYSRPIPFEDFEAWVVARRAARRTSAS